MGTEEKIAAEGDALLKFCLASGGAIAGCVFVVALGLSDGRGLVEAAVWIAIAAGAACLARSLIHIFWGGYLTRHPSHHPHRRELVELNALVPLNVLLSGFWIWLGFSTLGDSPLDPPLVPALLISVGVTLVGMETVRCVRWTKKRRGTEIVCEGPVGAWFRDFFKTSNEGTGPVHKVMVFLRNPNKPKTISRFLMVLTALLLIPTSVDASTSVGLRINRLIFGTPSPMVAGSDRSTRQGQENGDPYGGDQTDTPGEEGSREEQCGAVYEGWPAPSPNREELAGLFEAAGSEAAGCPRPAKEVAGQERVWYANSYCGGELRATGVTAPEYLPAILYQQAARFADAQAREGVLLGASSRWRYQGGDLYVINTTSGSFVLARRLASAGETETEQGPLPCQSYTNGNIPYTVVPPGLVALWLELAETEWVWPQNAGMIADDRSFEFVPSYPSDDVVATAICVSDLQCVLSVDGEERPTPGLFYTSIPEIASVAQ